MGHLSKHVKNFTSKVHLRSSLQQFLFMDLEIILISQRQLPYLTHEHTSCVYA